jgi:hypothetical protein
MEKNYDIIFTGLAQNCENHIDKFFNIYNQVKKDFKTAAIISENNSDDRTFTKIIEKLSYDNDIYFLDTTFIEKFYDRIHRLAHARQFQKDFVIKENFKAKYLIVIDLDDVLDFKFELDNFKSLLNFLDKEKKFYFGLSVKSKPHYYDILNFESKKFPNLNIKKLQLDKKINTYKERKNKIYTIQKKITESKDFECISAFNGMCVYNFNDYLIGKYFNQSSLSETHTIPEHLNMNRQIYFKTKKKIYVTDKFNFKMPEEHKPLFNPLIFFLNKFIKYLIFYFKKLKFFF